MVVSEIKTKREFLLSRSEKTLDEISIENPNIRIKKDTIEYKIDSVLKPDIRKIEDLIRQTEGFSVDGDGKILYRGRSVSSVMIEGDDLTRDQYQLITRNINAELFSHIQVIENYNRSKILGTFTSSNEIAINLKLKKTSINKLNGSATAALGTRKRYHGDLSLAYLSTGIKSILLTSINTIALDPSGTWGHRGSGIWSTYQTSDANIPRTIKGSGVITGSSVFIPEIDPAYTADNRTRLLTPILNIHLTKVSKLTLQPIISDDNLRYKSENNTFVAPDQSNSWNISSKSNKNLGRKLYGISAEWKVDQEKFTSLLNLDMHSMKGTESFDNLSSGAIIDTLNELIKKQNSGISGSYMLVRKLSDHTAIRLKGSVEYSPENIQLQQATTRWRGLIDPIDNSALYLQSGMIKYQTTTISGDFLQNKKKSNSDVGIEWTQTKFNVNGTLRSQMSEDRSNSSSQLSKLWLYGTKRIDLSIKNSISMDIRTGVGRASTTSTTDLGIYALKLNYKHAIKTFSAFNVLLGAKKDLPLITMLYQPGYISGNFMYKQGNVRLSSTQDFNGSLTYTDFKITSKFSIQFYSNLSYSPTTYASSFFFQPAYTQSAWTVVHNNWAITGGANLSRFLPSINATVKTNLFASTTKNHQIINDKNVENNIEYVGYSFSVIPSFAWSIKFQADFTGGKTFIDQKNDASKSYSDNTNWSAALKAKTDFTGKWFISGQYSMVSPTDRNLFHLLSAKGTYAMSKMVNIDFSLHNILNTNPFISRNIEPNMTNSALFYGVGRYFLFGGNINF